MMSLGLMNMLSGNSTPMMNQRGNGSWINIGGQIERWCRLQHFSQIMSHEAMTRMLLDTYELQVARLECCHCGNSLKCITCESKQTVVHDKLPMTNDSTCTSLNQGLHQLKEEPNQTSPRVDENIFPHQNVTSNQDIPCESSLSSYVSPKEIDTKSTQSDGLDDVENEEIAPDNDKKESVFLEADDDSAMTESNDEDDFEDNAIDDNAIDDDYKPDVSIMNKKSKKRTKKIDKPVSVKSYSCKRCDFKADSKPTILIHCEENHDLCESSHHCKMCGRYFKSCLGLRNHVRAHLGPPQTKEEKERWQYEEKHLLSTVMHRCKICDKQFAICLGLQNHMQKHVNSLPKASNKKLSASGQCHECGGMFRQLERHVLLQHSDKRPQYLCNLCGKSFWVKPNYVFHMKRHSMKKEDLRKKCPMDGCDTILSLTCIRNHLRTVHLKSKMHTCPYQGCDKSFAETGNLKVHLRQHTGDHPYSCQFCDYHAKQKICLKLHMKNRHPDKVGHVYLGSGF